jgi:hypothetical protein
VYTGFAMFYWAWAKKITAFHLGENIIDFAANP